MIIIAGAGHPKSEKHITLNTEYCPRCNNNAFWILDKTKYYISLFFIPTVPFKTEYTFYCSICGNSKKITKEEFDRLLQAGSRPYN